MSKANILTLASTIALDLENDTTISQFFDDLIETMAFLPKPLFTEYTIEEITSGTATYSYDQTDMLKVLHAFMSDTEIFMTDENGLEAYSSTWRSASGTPIALTQDWLQRQYTFYPNPNISTSGTGGAAPLGVDYATNPVFIIYAKDRSSGFAEYYALPLALLALAREFSYDALQASPVLAQNCDKVGKLILKLLGH